MEREIALSFPIYSYCPLYFLPLHYRLPTGCRWFWSFGLHFSWVRRDLAPISSVGVCFWGIRLGSLRIRGELEFWGDFLGGFGLFCCWFWWFFFYFLFFFLIGWSWGKSVGVVRNLGNGRPNMSSQLSFVLCFFCYFRWFSLWLMGNVAKRGNFEFWKLGLLLSICWFSVWLLRKWWTRREISNLKARFFIILSIQTRLMPVTSLAKLGFFLSSVFLATKRNYEAIS